MATNKRNTERGQALILVVLGFVALLGFAALAIDGSMIYSDRRHAQNGSDASSLAGGGAAALSLENNFVTYLDWNCNSSKIWAAESAAVEAAIGRAGDNGYTIDDDIDDHNGVSAHCQVDDLISFQDKYIDILTNVRAQTDTALLHFVYSGLAENTVEAITRVRPRTPLAYGHAVVALNDAACSGNQNGVIFDGSSIVNINGGGVFSNGCLRGNGNDFTVDVTNGNVVYVGALSGTTTNIDPDPGEVPLALPLNSYAVPTPNYAGLPNRTQTGSTLLPGVYNKITLNNGELNFSPGLYVLTGSPTALKITGGTVRGEGITIYVVNGGIDIGGGAEIEALAAPDRSPDPSPAIPGVLFYLAEGNDSTVSLEGNSTSSYVGTIYAPSGDVKITGTNDTTPTFNTQIIGKNVEIGGNANLDILFNGPLNYSRPAMIELFK